MPDPAKPEPEFAAGDEAIYEDPQLGDRQVTITRRHWEPVTETWGYAHRTRDTGHRTISFHPESKYRRPED